MTYTYNEKGGDMRAVILGATDGDTFEIPAGHIIESVTTKKIGTTAGNLAIGANAIFEVATLTVTHVPSTDGNATVTLNTVGKTVALEQANIDVEFQTACTFDGVLNVSVDGATAVVIPMDSATQTTPALVAAAVDAGVFTGVTAVATDDTVRFRKTGGAIAAIAITQEATSITVEALTACTTNGVLHVTIDGGTTVEVAMDSTAQNTATKVATAINGTVYTGYTTSKPDATHVKFYKNSGLISTLTIDQEKGILVDIDTACTFDGGVNISIDGGAIVTVDFASGDTVGDIANKIDAGAFAGYTAVAVNTDHVLFMRTNGQIATVAIENEKGIIVDINSACTATGALKISVDSGATVEIPVTSGLTVGQIATAIDGGVFAGYTAVAFDTDHVLFLKNTGEIATVTIVEEQGIVATMTHACTYDGSVAVTLDSVLLDTVAVHHGDTTANMATHLAGGTYAGYTATVVDTTKVQFMKTTGEIATVALAEAKENGIEVTVTHGSDFDGSLNVTIGGSAPVNIPIVHGHPISSVVTAIAAGVYPGSYAVWLPGDKIQFMTDTGTIASVVIAESKEKGILVDITAPATQDGSLDVVVDAIGTVNIPVTWGMTASQVATAIAAGTYTGAYAAVVGGDHVEFMLNTGEIATVAITENKEEGILVEVTNGCDTADGVLEVTLDTTDRFEVPITNPLSVEGVVDALVAKSYPGYHVTKPDASHVLYMKETGEIATVAITEENGIPVVVTAVATYDGSLSITVGALDAVIIPFVSGDTKAIIADAIGTGVYTGYTAVSDGVDTILFTKNTGEILTGDVVIAESKEKGIITSISHGCGTTGALYVTPGTGGSAVEIQVTAAMTKAQVATAIAGGAYTGFKAFDLAESVLFMKDSGEIATVTITEESAILVEYVTPCFTSGNISLVLDGGAPVNVALQRGSITINVTAACSVSGNVGITLDGVLSNIAVANTDDASEVATLIADFNYGADYTADVVTDTTHVKFTRISAPLATVVVTVNATGVTTTQTALAGQVTAALVAASLAGTIGGYKGAVVDSTFVRYTKTTGEIVSIAIEVASTGVTRNIGPLDVIDTGIIWSIAAKADVTSGVAWTTPIANAGAVDTGVTTTVAAKAEVSCGVTTTINAKADVDSGVTWSIAAAAAVTSGMAWTIAAKADVDTGITWAVNSKAAVDTGVTWTINALADVDTGVTWTIDPLADEDTGITWTIGAVSGQKTIAETATIIRGTTFTGWTTGTGTTSADVTFTSTSFGNKTDAVYSAGATGATGAMVTTPQGVAGNGIIDSVALSGTDGVIQELTLIGSGKVQSTTANYTGYINIDTAALCDVFIQMQKLTTSME